MMSRRSSSRDAHRPGVAGAWVLCVAVGLGCGGTHRATHPVDRAEYAVDVETASAIVRDALADYPLVERGGGRFETRWLRAANGVEWRFDVHLDGPGGGPFMVRVDTLVRDPRSGVQTLAAPPAWLAARRERILSDVHARLAPLEVGPATAVVAAQ